MKTIHKYELTGMESFIRVEGFEKVLSVQVQNGAFMVWCEVDNLSMAESMLHVRAVFTGRERPPDTYTYIETVIQSGLVYHFYYKHG